MNTVLEQTGLFVGSVALMSVSSFVLTGALEKIGAAFRLSEGLLGVLTALGADAPEISSCVTALAAGYHELGVGVVLGSNIFNLAALLGLSAILTGAVRVTRAGALFNGTIAILVTMVAALLLLQLLTPPLAFLLIALIAAPYLYIIALGRTGIERLPLPNSMTNFLARTVEHVQEDARKNQRPQARMMDWLTLLPALFAIVAGSRGTVKSTLALAASFSIPHAVAGTLCIAALTGIPNAIAAIRLAHRSRGAAVETECFNSNTLNLIFGISLPAVVTGLGAPSSRTFFSLAWIGGMTMIATALLCWRGGLRRAGGIALVVLYLSFAAVIVLW
ncbi:MAG: sodium:calcium antiporter [Chthoniobacterales bacterium]